MDQDTLKQMVGEKAVEFIKDGMIVGLGTGSTVTYMVAALGKRVKEEHLSITCVATSKRTAKQARELGIEIKGIDDVPYVDLTIDGADEIDRNFQGIKGGGAAHSFEKVVATTSTKNIWIVDQSKMVDTLGAFPLPIEVIPYGSAQVLSRLEKEGLKPAFRLDENGDRTLTDSKNYVIDLHLGTIKHPHLLADYLIRQVGILEHGLFLDMVNTVIVGYDDGPKVIEARH